MSITLVRWRWPAPLLATALLCATSAAQPTKQAPVTKMLLNYSSAPWEQVLSQLADNLKLPLLMDVKPPGTFTYSDAMPRTPEEALDLINGALLAKDFTLLRGNQFLALAPLDKPLPTELVPTTTPADLAKRGANEFASLTMQLKHVDPASIQDEVKKFLGKHGTVAALTRLHLITVTDVAGNLRKLAPVVTQLDELAKPGPPKPVAPAPVKVERVYTLRNIEADKTLPVLQTILGKESAVAGPQNRSLIVLALEADQSRVENLLNKLDVEAPSTAIATTTVPKTYAPKIADAASLATSLQGIWSKKRSHASFSADKASNLLVVEAPDAIHKQVQAIIAELESAVAAKAAVERVIRPRQSDPVALLATLQTIFASTDVKLSLDPKGEVLIVRAVPAEQDRITKLLEQLDGPANAAGAPVEIAIPLKHATAATLVSTLGTLFPKPTAVTYDRGNNLLLVRASADVISKIQKLVERVDIPPSSSDRTEIVYTPKHSTPADMSTLLTKLFPAKANVTIVPAPGDQALILSVPKDGVDRIKSALELLDTAELSSPAVRVEVYTPKHLSPTILRDTIAKLHAARADVTVTLDSRSQGILVSAPDRVHKAIVALLPKIDAATPGTTATTQQIYKLRHAQAAELATTLQKLYPADRTQTEVSAEPANNLLLINATPEIHKKIGELLQKIDLPPEAKLQERIYRIDRLEINGLMTLLRTVFGADGKTTVAPSGDAHTVVVIASNAVHTKVEALLEKLKKEMEAGGANTAAAFRLQHATASQVSAALLAALPDAQTGGRITYEPTTNAILVAGPVELQSRVKDLIASLDIDPAGDLVQRDYPAKHVPALDLVQKLRILLPTSLRTSVSHELNREVVIVLGPPAGQERVVKLLESLDRPIPPSEKAVREVVRIKNATASTLATTLQTVYPPARFPVTVTADPYNSLIILDAPPAFLAQVKDLIQKLDIPATGEKIERTYALRHAKADKVQPQLITVFPAASNVVVAAGAEGHSLVVSATAEMHQRVEKLIAELDRVPSTPNRVEHVYRLKHATPSAMARSLQLALADASDAQFVPDDANRALIASIDPRYEQRVENLIQQADQPATSKRVERVFRLQHATASVLARSLQLTLADAVDSQFVPDDANRTLIASIDPRYEQRVNDLIQQSDRPATSSRVEKVYRLEYATASSLARSLQLALHDADAQFVPDDSNRTVIASIDPRHEQRIQELIKQADRPKTSMERQIAVLPLSTMEPSKVETIVRRIFDSEPSDVRPTIEATEIPPQLIVRGSEEQIKQVKSTLTQLGEQSSSPVGIRGPDDGKRTEPLLRAIRIDRGSPRAAAEAVRRLWPRLRRNPLILSLGDDLLRPTDSAPAAKDTKDAKDKEQRPLPGDPNVPVTLTAGNNRLLVSSMDPSAVRLVEQLVETLTEDPNPERGEFRVFPLEIADAADVVKAVDEAFNGRQQGQGGRRRLGGDRVRAVADPGGSALIVRASLVDLVSVENLIRTLDQKPAARNARSPRILPLKRAKADEVVTVLKEVYSDYLQPGSGGPMSLPGFSAKASGKAQALAIGVDQSSNSLVISAADEVFEQIKTLVGDLDKNLGEAGRSYRLLPLKNASPLDVEEALDILFDRPSDPKRKGGSSTPATRRATPKRATRPAKQRTTPQRKSGTTSTTNLKEPPKLSLGKPRPIEKTEVATIRPLGGGLEISDTRDGLSASNEKFDPAVIPAGFTDAARLIAQPAPASDIGGIGSRVEIRALPEIGVLLLIGDEAELKLLAEIVNRIEKLAADRRLTFRVAPLAYAKSAPLADLLRDLYRRMLDSKNAQSRTEAQAEIIPLAKPNALLLAASKDDVEFLVELANQFDTPVAADGQFTVFKLEHARSTDLARTVTSFYANRNVDGDLAPDIVVEADPRSNALVVHAAPRDLEEVKLLIKQLDTADTGLMNSLRVFPLRFGTADEVSRVLQSAIQGTGAAAGGDAPASNVRPRPSLQLILADGKNRRTVESSILDSVRITPNPRANTLIVSAPSQTMNLIEALIKQLDVRPEAQAEIKVFTLANSDAAAMVMTLRTLFLQAQGPNRNTTIAPAATTTGTGDSGSPLIELSFSVDPRTNSILAAGTKDQLEVVEAIILRLDGSNIEERKTEVHKLRNAIASDVATAITDLLQRQTDVNRLQEGVSLRQQIESEVVVVPEVTTNSLLISSTPRFYAKLLSVIEKLDEAPPQVVIQVLIVQVDLDKSNEFGIEVGLQDSILFRRGIFPGVATLNPTFTPQGVSITTNNPVTPGIPGFNFNSTGPLGNNPFTNNQDWVGGQGISNLGVGRSSSPGYGGLVLSASSESVNLLLRALSRDQRIEVLSRPQVMALDNQTAFIQVGQQVPVIQNSVIQSNVGVVNTVTYQDVGIILIVTPKISPDGSVVLRVDPEISALAPITDVDSRVEISTGVFARAINTTRAQTTVSSRDGQTAVIGGLIRRENSRETRKVPVLGDIPVVGWAFRYDQKRCVKRELLFFLTPHIVRNTEDAERIKQLEASRMNWCLSAPELAELGLPPRETAEDDSEKKSGHFWHRKKAKPASSTAPPGAADGLLPTTVSHEPPPLSSTTPKLDPSMWPKERPKTPSFDRSAGVVAANVEVPAVSRPTEKNVAAQVPQASTGNAKMDSPDVRTSPLILPMRWTNRPASTLPPPASLPSFEPSLASPEKKAAPAVDSKAKSKAESKAESARSENTSARDAHSTSSGSRLPKINIPPRALPNRLPADGPPAISDKP